MVTLQELSLYLEELLQCSVFSDFCPNGIQVEGTREIQHVATGVTASLSTIEEAVKQGAQALLVHHGMFWNRDSYVVRGIKRKKLNLLIKHDIALLAYHLPLDAHQSFGNNWKAARDLGWSDLQPFGVMNGVPIGVKGKVPSQSRQAFKNALEAYYQHPAHAALGGKDTVESAALISGGAHRNVVDAIAEGVDCFVTGSFDEPNWHQAFEEKINFFAMGHSATERIGPKALGNHLSQEFQVEHAFIDIPNPF